MAEDYSDAPVKMSHPVNQNPRGHWNLRNASILRAIKETLQLINVNGAAFITCLAMYQIV